MMLSRRSFNHLAALAGIHTFWGDYSRMIGNDDPYSLFLAMGIPFEVTETPSTEGYTFLSDADAQAVLEGALSSNGSIFVSRQKMGSTTVRTIPEDLESLFALKQSLLPTLNNVPYVIENQPVVCAWYPTANRVLLWNLMKTEEILTLCYKEQKQQIQIPPLGIRLAEV